MVSVNFAIVLVFLAPLKISEAVNAYCSVPCPFMYPASPPAYQVPQPRTPILIGRSYMSYDNLYADNDVDEKESPTLRTRQPEPSKPKPEEEESSPPRPKKKSAPSPARPESPPTSTSPPSPQNRRFFTSLFSIPGAVVDTLLSGEIVL